MLWLPHKLINKCAAVVSIALTAMSCALGQVELVSTGSVWKYLDDGSDPGTHWRTNDFDDATWASGPAILGYGEGDERTVVAFGAFPQPVTLFFRHSFVSTNTSFYGTLRLRVLRDDGVIVYLNGSEVFRDNLRTGPINPLTRATVSVAGEEERQFIQHGIWPYALRPGTNVLAVELHQSTTGEDDASFDLELVAGLPVTPPVVSLTHPTNGAVLPAGNVTFTAVGTDLDGHIYRVGFLTNGVEIGSDLTPPFSFVWTNAPPGRYVMTAEAVDNSGRRSSSQAVRVQVGEVTGTRLSRGPYLQTGTPTSVIVRWRTDWFADSRVVFGTSLNELNRMAASSELRTEHTMKLEGLQPDTRYYYAVGTSEEIVASGPDHYFVTSPTNARPTRVWVIGDSGTANQRAAEVWNAYVYRTGNRHTDLWLMLGDNAYEEGTDFQYQRSVFDMYPAQLRKTVLWPTIGNHDAAIPDANGNFPYLDIFTLPKSGEAGGVASGTERYYSFDYANIHFICLDSQTSDRSPRGPMLTWLENDLAQTSLDWIIAYWHHPPYTKGTHDSDYEFQLIEMRENALPILERHGVDLVLCGHSHVYERSYLLNGHYGYSTNLTSTHILDASFGREDWGSPYKKPAGGIGAHQGTIYAVCGCSGEGGEFIPRVHPAMRVTLGGHGSMILEIDGNRLDATFLRNFGDIDDMFTIVKGSPGPSVKPRLEISRTDERIELNWPTSLTPLLLEEATLEAPTIEWTMVTNATATVGRRHVLKLEPSGAHRMFQLRAEPPVPDGSR